MFQTNLSHPPAEIARTVITNAFDKKSKSKRDSMRVINRVMTLAKDRGYNNEDAFFAHFSEDHDHHSKHARRILHELFAFVSPDEFVQLANLDLRLAE